MGRSDCKHDRYKATAKMEFVRMPELNAHQLVLRYRITCARCLRPFTFHAHHGFSTREPTVSNDGVEVRLPLDYPVPDEVEVEVDVEPPEPGGSIH